LIYTDGVHLIDDGNIEELHDFAVNNLGFKREWFQDNSPPQHPHYDLTTARAKKRAIEAGAIYVKDIRQFVEILKQRPAYQQWLASKNKT
jgi:hypothetical protein